MAYAECETALATLLKTLNSAGQFTDTTWVTQKDYSVLDKNGVMRCAVLMPGSVGHEPSRGSTYTRIWDVMLDLFVKNGKEASTMADLATIRDAVIRKIDQNPNLSGTAGVHDVFIVSDGDPVPVNKAGDAVNTIPIWISQRFRVSIYQTLTV